MANTLTNLIPDLYEALDVVSRELVGFIPAVTRDSGIERAAVGQTVRSHVAPASASSNIVPGVTAPNDGDQVIGNVPLTISKAKTVPVRWNGEEQRGVNSGSGYRPILRDQFSQAMRTLCNEIEVDVAGTYALASRSFGTPGTVPFGVAGNYTDASNSLRILLDNGAPASDLQMVINTAAGANLRGIQGGRVNESGSVDLLRQGVLFDIHGFSIRESAGIRTHTKGTAAGSTTNAAGYAVGATTITLASAGTGTILAGDSITFAGDTNQYVVLTGDADVSGGGTVVLAAPGLRQAIPASATAITVLNSGPRSMAFRRSAIVLATRAPALPEEGDMADDRMIVQDPRSGLAFEVSLYRQYRQIRYEVSMAWGWQLVKPEHASLLLG